MTRFSCLLIAIAVTGCASVETPVGRCPRSVVKGWAVAADRLEVKESVGEAESANLVDGVPFGAVNAEWTELKSRLRPDDQLWRFRQPKKPGLYGALEGYVIVRDCEIVDQLVLVWD